MGASKRQIYNSSLMNMASYTSIKSIKMLLTNIHNMKRLAEMGDSVSASIVVDLLTAVSHQSLTEKQRQAVILKFFYRFTYEDIAEVMDVKSTYSVRKHIDGGLKKVRRVLGGDG